MKKFNIHYITYQTFPAETANSQQTISNIKYLVKNNCKVSLIFPLRDKESSESIDEIKNFYGVNESFKVIGISHNLPFGKVKFFNKIAFHISHYLWSKKTIKKYYSNSSFDDIFITRSDWIFYFLLKNNKKVIFECHQLSKIRKIILKSSLKNKKAKIIFLNNKLKDSFISSTTDRNSIVLQNGVDLEFFNNLKEKKKEVVFVGNLKRFNKERNIKFIINGFLGSDLSNSYKLKIIGGPNETARKLAIKINKISNVTNIEVLGRLGRKETIEHLEKAEIGIMINSSENKHSLLYTSPLKYFEYLASNIKIVAVDFPSHRDLPYSENISFFNENNLDTLINSLNEISKKSPTKLDKSTISLDYRAKKIKEFIAI
tara:strand:+ start:266 stop:1384 length:1119 start_codon:yes stop_codon:yes gene_type:complete